MKFIVTGAGGFLGSNVVRKLLERGHEVLAASSQDRETIISRIGQRGGHNVINHRKLEVCKNSKLLSGSSLDTFDSVVNCAFPWNRDGYQMALGLEFHRNLLELIRDLNIPTFVNVSSQSLYPSDRHLPAKEEDSVVCHSPYTTGKYAMELMSSAILGENRVLNARVSSLIGVSYEIRLVNRLIVRALNSQPLVIKGGQQEFDYMDVRDAAGALAKLGEIGVVDDQSVVNVGAGHPATLLQIAHQVKDIVREETGLEVDLELEDAESPHTTSAIDNSRLGEVYGFYASIPLDRTIHWILDSHRAQAEPVKLFV